MWVVHKSTYSDYLCTPLRQTRETTRVLRNANIWKRIKWNINKLKGLQFFAVNVPAFRLFCFQPGNFTQREVRSKSHDLLNFIHIDMPSCRLVPFYSAVYSRHVSCMVSVERDFDEQVDCSWEGRHARQQGHVSDLSEQDGPRDVRTSVSLDRGSQVMDRNDPGGHCLMSRRRCLRKLFYLIIYWFI